MNLSKSRYTTGVTCGKKLWLSCYKPEEAEESENDDVFDNGTKIGELARGLLGDYVLVDYDTNYQNMINKTQEYLLKKPNIICEASFSYDGNFCSVDILKNDLDGVELYEVKSSTKIGDIYLEDISYQTWLLRKSNINVKKACLIRVNNNYVKQGEFDINKYFIIEDVTDKLDLDLVEENVKGLKEIINKKDEPNIDLSTACNKPYPCPFFKYCTKKLPTPNVFDIGWKLQFQKKLDMYYRHHVSFEDVLNKEVISNQKALVQVKSFVNNTSPVVNKDNIKMLLDSITYPLYFLDFESFQDAVPRIDGTRPYQQICFQYSLHYYLKEDGKLYHKEYLSDEYDGDPMYGLCKRLTEDIPKNACVIVYNKGFEQPRLREMAKLYPEFSEHLLNIHDNIVDLMIPFMNQDYYVKEMMGRSSIKLVLPALFPDDPECSYDNLDQVHKGDEASAAYLLLPTLSKEEQERLRYNMLKYCGRDTYATVKLYEKLREVIKEKNYIKKR